MSENQQNRIAGSLTYPTRNENNAEPLPEQPRQPRNLQGLLRFAMEATKAEDAPGESELSPMDEERRKFLEEAIRSLSVDLAEVIRNAIKVLTDTEMIKSIQLGQPVPDDVQQAFDNLLEWVDDMDVANDFYKLGGFAVFPICLSSENECVRALACSLLGECCQNNPYCQSRALECGLVNVLISLVQSESGTTLAKTVYALSCACREYPPACAELVSQGGCSALWGVCSTGEVAARTKAAFLIRYLCHNYPPAKEKLIAENLVGFIATQIKSGRDSTTEHLLSIILALLEDNNLTVIKQCNNPEINLKKVLEAHLKHEDLADDSFREEKQYCKEIIDILKGYPMESEEVDR